MDPHKSHGSKEKANYNYKTFGTGKCSRLEKSSQPRDEGKSLNWILGDSKGDVKTLFRNCLQKGTPTSTTATKPKSGRKSSNWWHRKHTKINKFKKKIKKDLRFFFSVLGIVLWVSCIQGRCSTLALKCWCQLTRKAATNSLKITSCWKGEIK